MKTRPYNSRGRAEQRGFTLIELLVVIALTSLLLLLLFTPLYKSLELASRAAAQVKSQDDVRSAMRRVIRDLNNALEVSPPQDVKIWGYNTWSYARNRPQPTASAVSEAYLLRSGAIAFRLPKHQYWCKSFNHYVTSDQVGGTPDLVALDQCPLHPGSLLELRPLSPLQPEDRVTAYFVALKDPSLRDANGNPTYLNNLLFLNAKTATLNQYALYRVQFDPKDPRYVTFLGDSSAGIAADPGFFYDPTPIKVGNVTKPRYAWWKDLTISMMDPDTSDVVRWIQTGDRFLPHSLCSFAPGPIGDEVAAPNRTPGLYPLGGTFSPADFPAPEFTSEHAHWVGLTSVPANLLGLDQGKIPIPDSITLPGANALFGPQIQVLAQSGSGSTRVFDTVTDSTFGPANRQRMVMFDALTGRVLFSIPRRQYAGGTYTEEYAAQLDPSLPYTSVLTADVQKDPNNMPSSFGALVADSRFAPTGMIAPGSESIRLATTANPPVTLQQFHRAGYSLTAGDVYPPQMDLQPYEYTINYKTGRIYFFDRDPNVWANDVVGGGTKQLLVKYKFQTNTASDVVRVSYTTRELQTVNLGVVEYTRKNQEQLPFEISERVSIRNLKR